jgi:methyl-accepting chemotaxis protein
MQSIRRLRSRLYVMTLPLVVVVVFASGVIASFESKAALTRVANRHLAFKAEQLRDYFFSEWEVITQLGLDDQAEYRNAVEQSFRSYAFSLLRGETELIAVYDDRGDPVMRIRLAVPVSDSSAGGTVSGPVSLSAGWFTSELFGEPRVGVAFMLEPFGWTVAVTELSETFFSDIQNIQQTHLVILVAAAVVMTVFLSVFIGHVTRPVERLTVTIGRITETNDLAQRARIESADEIGILAKTFNTMIETLQRNYRQVEATSLSEKQSRQLAVEREI